ncbi:MAG: hypothetical protein P1V97_38340, partial [Planctomycetota bacterium]|nr:hypothetical protein [Planctomycetota bacterium]
ILKILSERGLELKGRRELTLRGPVKLEIPPEYFKKQEPKKSKKDAKKKAADKDAKKNPKDKKSSRSSDFLESWFPKGAYIESQELVVNFLLPEGSEKNIQGFHLICRGQVRMKDLATKETRGRCETLEIILLSNHWSGEIARGLGSLGGASLMSLENLSSPDLAYFRAEENVEFKGLVKNDPKKEASHVQLTADFLERELDKGELTVRGEPASLIERDLKGVLRRKIQANDLHMSEESSVRTIEASGNFFANLFLESSEIKLRGDEAWLEVEEIPAPKLAKKSDKEKKSKPSQEIKAFRLIGAPGTVEEIRKRRSRRLEAKRIQFDADESMMSADGKVYAHFRRTSKDSETRNELNADQLEIVFEDNPFKGLKLDDALKKEDKDKKAEPKKDKAEKPKKAKKKLDIGGQIKKLRLRGEKGARIKQNQGDETRQLQAREITFEAKDNDFELTGDVLSTWKNPKKKLDGRLTGDKGWLRFSKNPFKDTAKKEIKKTGDPKKDKALKEKAKKESQSQTLNSLESVRLNGRPAKILVVRDKQTQSFEANDIRFLKESQALELNDEFLASVRKGSGEKLQVTEMKGDRARFRMKENPFAMVEGLTGRDKEKSKDPKGNKQFDLTDFDSMLVDGPSAELYTKQDSKEPSMRMKAQAFSWDSKTKTMTASPAKGERVTIGRDDGLELEADTVKWLHEDRILILKSEKSRKKLVLLKDKEGSAGQAEVIVMHWPESSLLNELELSRGPEIILDLVGQVRLKTKSDGAFLSSTSKKDKDKKAKKKTKKQSPKEKKRAADKAKKKAERSIPLLLQCDSARVFLIQQSDPDLSGYDISMALMQGKDNQNV